MTTTTRTKIAHIWRRLGFGPAPGDIDSWEAAGPQALINNLLSRPAITSSTSNPNPWGFPSGTDYLSVNMYVSRMLELMAFGPSNVGTGLTSSNYNPVQERIAWILQGLIVTAVADVTTFVDVADHIKLLRNSVFGSYKQLLNDVSTRPGMLKYLTGYQNTKLHPNQNYARELMELFSIGRVHPLTGAANYGQGDIQELARALSGWQYDWTTGATSFNPANWDSGVKTFRGQSLGNAGLPEVINALAAHPSFAYYVPKRFYQELVGLDPTQATLTQLVSAWGPSGDIRSLVSAIVHLPDFLSDAAIFSKVKQPVELVAGAARLVSFPGLTSSVLSLPYNLTLLNQHPLTAPNVRGWPRGDQWLGASNLSNWSQLASAIAVPGLQWNGISSVNPLATTIFSNATASTAATLALRLSGLDNASQQTWARLNDYAQTSTWTISRAASLVYLMLLSPEFLVA